MKSWKDQLRELRNALRESGGGKERGEASPKIDFEPPPEWLTDGPSIRKKSPARNSAQKSAASTVVGASADKPSAGPDVPTPSPFKPRIDDGCALNKPDWADVGKRPQHPEHRGERSKPMTVRIGIDFGTAFTKVAIRAGTYLLLVKWSDVTGDNSETGHHILPGMVTRMPDGEFCWRRLAGADIRANLKLPVIEMAGNGECPVATAAYLALVIRYARAFLYKSEIGRTLAGRSLRWELNIGCPTKPLEKPEVVDIFRRLARTAWLLAAEDRLMEDDIVAAWNLAVSAIELGLETEPGVVPEFVAQIAGYLKSIHVREGLHALIDIGAATLDVATFNVVLRNDGSEPPRIPIFFSMVRLLGTHYLRHDRHTKFGLELSWDDAAPVESADDFARRHSQRPDKVMDADGEFSQRVATCIFRVIDATRTNRRGDPNSQAWREGLPVFITGGGASCRVYRDAIQKAQEKLQNAVRAERFSLIELDPYPTLGNGERIQAGARLTVAIGLTEDAENIALVVPHRDIEPIRYETRERVDHTELYGDR